MNDKVKSFLYFATLVISVVMYYNVGDETTVQTSELAENNSIEFVSTPEALN